MLSSPSAARELLYFVVELSWVAAAAVPYKYSVLLNVRYRESIEDLNRNNLATKKPFCWSVGLQSNLISVLQANQVNKNGNKHKRHFDLNI